MKKLLADEMTRETEPKRRAPSVIARLMGLDGIPLQQHANKQPKGSSENHLQRSAQLEKTHSSGTLGRSSRRSSKDQQEFKDVFEVSEIPKVESKRYPSQCEDVMETDAEISFIEQKFLDAKRLATDRDSLSSKEFDDTLEVLDSNTDLLLKYFQRPDSLFKKHLNDLQASPLRSHCGHIEAMKSSSREEYEHGDFRRKPARDSTRLNFNISHHKHHDGYPGQFDRRHAVRSSPYSPKFQSTGKDNQGAVPTRIVVLKPNLGKLQNATKSSCSSHAFLSESGKSAAFPDVRNRGLELHEKEDLPDNIGFLRQNAMESREIAKEITRQMKSSLFGGLTVFSSSRFRGDAGDDSSCEISGNESAEESEVTAVTLANSVDLNNRSRPSSRSSESSVSREAKKRLSDRWKMTHKSEQVQAINRGSTLADMLAIPDKETNATNFESSSFGEGFHNKFANNGKPTGSVEPLGISSRDGWKDGCIGSLSRSRSLPASSNGFGSPRTHVDRFMKPKEALKRERRKASMGFYQQEGVNTRTSKSGHKKSWSSHYTSMEIYESSPDINTIQDKVKTNPEEEPPKQEVPPSDSLTEILRDTSVITRDVVDAALENSAGSSEIVDQDLPELSSCVFVKGNTSTIDEDSLLQQELSVSSSSGTSVSSRPPVPGLESSPCKDADQPSPVSVLEPSFTDDLSSCSECFESLSADLQGLRMQLQMLKLESEEHVEGPMLISSDDDGGEASIGISRENVLYRTEESWEFSYIIDVLSASGIDAAHPLTYSEAWHSPECPLSPSLFDELEKRYSDCSTCPRSERRLLFDRINLGILNMCQQFGNDRPWVNPTIADMGFGRMKKGVRDGLCMLLRSQGKVKDDALGTVLARESQWLDVKDEADAIGRDVEKLILDDLVEEIAATPDPSAADDGGQNCAFLTFDTLANTLIGVTSPTIVTFFAAKSMLKEVTPAHISFVASFGVEDDAKTESQSEDTLLSLLLLLSRNAASLSKYLDEAEVVGDGLTQVLRRTVLIGFEEEISDNGVVAINGSGAKLNGGGRDARG
ncbi:uncharacterized protein G2W53_043643 [Senna tora]|uniref:DUF3741 domain-containing protein n=1 Tax=Senna tora TaxID=362788 RepID=A0A834W0D4_9FABA|nr:uncharacterized protein G2W53_043643 [Senna tora]